MQSHLLAAAVLATTTVLAGCMHPTRAQHDIDHGWAVYGRADATVRGVDPEVGPEQLPRFVDSGTRVVLTGTVDQVCRTMGCWLDIAGKSGETVRVMNRDHGFFIPRLEDDEVFLCTGCAQRKLPRAALDRAIDDHRAVCFERLEEERKEEEVILAWLDYEEEAAAA